jgi:hypothetical protein
MAILSFKLDQLFILLVPDLVQSVGAAIFPSEPAFVQKDLSIWSHLVMVIIGPLMTNPPPQRLVMLVPEWFHAMTIGSLKLDQLFILVVPELVVLVEVVRDAGVNFPSEPNVV